MTVHSHKEDLGFTLNQTLRISLDDLGFSQDERAPCSYLPLLLPGLPIVFCSVTLSFNFSSPKRRLLFPMVAKDGRLKRAEKLV